jgi:transposase
VPILRDDHPAAGAQPPDRTRARRAGAARPSAVRQVWPASAHLPLNRQSNVYAREGIDLDVSTLAD